MAHPQSRRDELMQAFREALLVSSGHPDADQLAREGMLISVVGDDEMVGEWHRIAGPEQAVFDIHLAGAGVEDNAASASKFAQFVSRIDSTVHAKARDAAGVRSYSHKLLIQGAEPGSVRVVLRVPEPTIPEGQEVDDSTVASTVDSDALRLVASIIGHGDDISDDSVVISEIQALPTEARKALRKAMEGVQTAGWEIQGSISQRGFGYQEVALTTQGAARLRHELTVTEPVIRTAQLYGKINGTKDIEGVLWFEPEGGKEFRAIVGEDRNLRDKIVQLQLGHPRVRADFTIYESHSPDGTTMMRSRTLEAVELAPRAEQTTIPT